MMKVLSYGWHLCSVFKMKANSAFKHQEYSHRGNIKERNHKTEYEYEFLFPSFFKKLSLVSFTARRNESTVQKRKVPTAALFFAETKHWEDMTPVSFIWRIPARVTLLTQVKHERAEWNYCLTFILPGNAVVHRPWEQRERNEKCSMINQNPKSDFCSTKARRALYAHSPSHYSLKATEKHWEEFDYIQCFT